MRQDKKDKKIAKKLKNAEKNYAQLQRRIDPFVHKPVVEVPKPIKNWLNSESQVTEINLSFRQLN